ncbi:MAG: methionine--tRNA ligase subunit beta, partial [Gammaproteobacteria bacterium]|nr:methionine--tRNA ligase subunit beta [Gammaproteobacteria bacterium]
LFWPAMLQGAGYRTPTAIFAHGFLTVNGQKMSKSRGTFITARTYLDHLKPEYLRYYFATKLNGRVEDLDLNLEDFVQRVNSDLVGKVVNIASRCVGFIHKRFAGQLADELYDADAYREFVVLRARLVQSYEQREYSRAMRDIMAYADRANQFIADHKPWEIAKQPGQEDYLHRVCTSGLNMFRVLTTYLAPVLPATARRAEELLGCDLTGPGAWQALDAPLVAQSVAPFTHLMQRVETKAVDAMIEASKPETKLESEKKTSIGPLAADPVADTITFEEFAKVDLRVARIVRAEPVEGADKLLRLTVDLGGETRNIFAGIKSAYAADDLEGRLTVVAANLAPRKMRFGVSEGMVVAAGPGGADLWLLAPDPGAIPGMRIK